MTILSSILPAFLIATVDKFASLPWEGRTGKLFGKATHVVDGLGFYGPADGDDASKGVRLADRESIQLMLGNLAMQIEIGRMLTMKAAWEIDRGGYAKKEVSMAKVQVANTLHAAADTAIQINGARGYSGDTVLEWIYRYARQARLVDGADEVHKMVLNRHLAAEGGDFWQWPVAE